MKIAVIGQWHLGSVMAACLAHVGHDVLACDPDPDVCDKLRVGRAVVSEPGLDLLLEQTLAAGKLRVVRTPQEIQQADIVWVAFDTPVDEMDIADTGFVEAQVKKIAPYLKEGALLLVSSQLPVGTTRYFKQLILSQFPAKSFTVGYIPENLRLGKAIEVFLHPDRFVVGLEEEQDQEKILAVFGPITDKIIWMSIESAEMTKHALNAFLALSVTFINEIAGICEEVGADARDVERGLKSESRIGSGARLSPGGPIAGGTLLRDVGFLAQQGKKYGCQTHLMDGIRESNDFHKGWLQRKLQKIITGGERPVVAVLGLTYKAGTDTLRRSASMELCQWLHQSNIQVMAYDPAIKKLPGDAASFISLKADMLSALRDADVAVVATEYDEFRSLNADAWVQAMRMPRVFDPGGWLMKLFQGDQRIAYQAVGGVF